MEFCFGYIHSEIFVGISFPKEIITAKGFSPHMPRRHSGEQKHSSTHS
jgi:hypothetical protein